MMMDKYKFGEFIYTQRKSLGLTQDELGRKLKVTNKAVSKWETGETLPDIQLLPELASVLNVTIDELLTQNKPEVEKVFVDPKKKVRVFLWIVCMILLVTSICLAFLVFKYTEKKEELISVENASEYFEITPCENFVAEGYGVNIYGSIVAKSQLEDPLLTLEFTIQYYYINKSGDICEVLYDNRKVSYDPLANDFSIILRPKSQMEDRFKSFYAVKVSYEIVEAGGSVER